LSALNQEYIFDVLCSCNFNILFVTCANTLLTRKNIAIFFRLPHFLYAGLFYDAVQNEIGAEMAYIEANKLNQQAAVAAARALREEEIARHRAERSESEADTHKGTPPTASSLVTTQPVGLTSAYLLLGVILPSSLYGLREHCYEILGLLTALQEYICLILAMKNGKKYNK